MLPRNAFFHGIHHPKRQRCGNNWNMMAKRTFIRRKPRYRLATWDYGSNGHYFITIVTTNRMPAFGQIDPCGISLSVEGAIVDGLIRLIPSQFPYARVLTHVVMPDHLHLLLCLEKTEADFQADAPLVRSNHLGGPIPHCMHRNDIPRIVRWLKARGSFEIRKDMPEFGWIRSYHDRVMRSRLEVRRHAAYIDANPRRAWVKMQRQKQ